MRCSSPSGHEAGPWMAKIIDTTCVEVRRSMSSEYEMAGRMADLTYARLSGCMFRACSMR
jgi:hypothetical protein